MPHESRATPLITDLRGVGAGISVGEDRIFLRWIEISGLDHHRLHLEAISSLHSHEFRFAQIHLGKHRNRILIDDSHQIPIC